MKLVALKLTETEYAAVQELVSRGNYKTVSGLLRAGLMDLLSKEKVKLETQVKIRLERIGHPMRRARGFRSK